MFSHIYLNMPETCRLSFNVLSTLALTEYYCDVDFTPCLQNVLLHDLQLVVWLPLKVKFCHSLLLQKALQLSG